MQPKFLVLYVAFFFSLISFSALLTDGKSLVQITSDNIDNYVDGKKFFFLFFYAPWHEHSQKVLEIFDEVADEFANRDDVVVGKADAYEDVKLATRFWVDRYPIFKYFIKGCKTEETYKGGHKAEDFIRFIQARSAIIFNKDIFTVPVIELDGSNFERIVKDRTKNLMVFYYNGNCRRCEQMEYPYYQVGLAFRNEPNCVLAKMNCDKNKEVCLEQLIPRYPTIKVYSTSNKDGITYEPGKQQEMYTEGNITMFMNTLCKTQRLPSGRLDNKAGRLSEFDQLAADFVNDWHRREHILRTVREKTADRHDKEYASYYAIIMTRIINEGSHVVRQEINRLERLIAGHVHANKADELEKKKNILKHFHELHQRDEL